jgi:hypothetical protein
LKEMVAHLPKMGNNQQHRIAELLLRCGAPCPHRTRSAALRALPYGILLANWCGCSFRLTSALRTNAYLLDTSYFHNQQFSTSNFVSTSTSGQQFEADSREALEARHPPYPALLTQMRAGDGVPRYTQPVPGFTHRYPSTHAHHAPFYLHPYLLAQRKHPIFQASRIIDSLVSLPARPVPAPVVQVMSQTLTSCRADKKKDVGAFVRPRRRRS